MWPEVSREERAREVYEHTNPKNKQLLWDNTAKWRREVKNVDDRIVEAARKGMTPVEIGREGGVSVSYARNFLQDYHSDLLTVKHGVKDGLDGRRDRLHRALDRLIDQRE